MNYFVVEVPLNADGQGPEIRPSLVVQIAYEVWDDNFQSVAIFDTREGAEYYAAELTLNQADL